MAKKDKKSKEMISTGTVAKNRRAFFDYAIDEKFEAGIVLTGTEVKSLRHGRANIQEAYAAEKEGELYLTNSYIAEYSSKGYSSHDTRRQRKLLLHKKELAKLIGAVSKKGNTIVPISLYFNVRGVAKVQIGLGTGKKHHDKRETTKQRDWNRDKARILRDKN
jgi:SsrA-binding protein